MIVPPSWADALAALAALRALPPGGAAMLIGNTDAGKTTFAAYAARTLAENGARVAVVDADIGQSEIGPPGTVAVAWAKPDAARLSDLKPAATFFVGAFGATALPLEHATAAARATRHARERQADCVLVDTTGFVSGAGARRLKAAKAALIAPALVLAFGADTDDETATAARAAAAVCGGRLLPVAMSPAVQKKPPAQRATRRQTRLAAYFGDAPQTAVVPLGAHLVTLGAALGGGVPVAPHLAAWVGETLGMPVVHGETAGGVLTIFVAGAVRAGWEGLSGVVTDYFRARTLRVVSLAAYEGVLLGLHDDTGRLFSLARYAGFDTVQVGFEVVVPGAVAAQVREKTRLAVFGRVRLDGSGASLAELKPGEL